MGFKQICIIINKDIVIALGIMMMILLYHVIVCIIELCYLHLKFER